MNIIRAGLERSNEDMRRTLTDFITSTAEIAQEQNHMIEASVVTNRKIGSFTKYFFLVLENLSNIY